MTANTDPDKLQQKESEQWVLNLEIRKRYAVSHPAAPTPLPIQITLK